MGQYKTNKQLKEIGLIDGKDLSTEAAVTKAIYLLGKKMTSQQCRIFFETPLR